MINQLVNLFNRTLLPQKTEQVRRHVISQNPFATYNGNPFVNSQNRENNHFYGKNRPVSGGYFAGYYNGKPNIVGSRLFIEV